MIAGASWLGIALVSLMMLLGGGWGALAMTFAGPGGYLGHGLAGAIATLTLAAIVGFLTPARRGRSLALFSLLFTALLLWWSGIVPANDRDWHTDVAVLPAAEFDGQHVTVRNVRNFDYRSETDYTPAYYDRRFDLDKLSGVDLVAVYWMGPAIAHVFLSFAFEDGEHLAISIETRKERSEDYSTIKGLFRQYELFYVVADERDVIRLRTNYRHDPPEDVYVYRVGGSLNNGRRLFLEYMRRINALNAQPEFYNTLTTNCTTNIWTNTHVNGDHLPFSWKILASGYVPEYLHEQGRLASGNLPFPQIREQALINGRAQAADQAPDFSARIRSATHPAKASP